jgi:hypothetical protein
VPTKVSGSWSVATSSSEFLLGAQVDNLQLTVRQANKITGFHAGLNSFAIASYSGCITGASHLALIEYAAKRAGPWQPLRHAFWAGGCRLGTRHGLRFRGSARARLAGAASARETMPHAPIHLSTYPARAAHPPHAIRTPNQAR